MKIAKRLAFFLLIIYVSFTGFMYFNQERVIFPGATLASDFQYSFPIPFEEKFFAAPDGASLNGLHFRVTEPKGVVLYFHGNAGNLDRWGNIASYFTTLQYDVLVIDYRTYGKSTGAINEAAMLADTQMFYDYLLQHYQETEIVVYGRSLGTSFATYTASKNNPKKLILESPFYSLSDVAKRKYPFLPLRMLLKYKLPSGSFMETVRCPVTIYHGVKDGVVPYKSGKRLAKKVPESRLQFISIAQGGHHDLIEFEEYTGTIESSLK